MDSDSDSSVNYEEEMEDINRLMALNQEPLDYASQPSTSAYIAIPSNSQKHIQEITKIDSALTHNKVLDEKYKRLETLLTQRLKECREKLQENAKKVQNETKHETFRYQLCGKPYFKDHMNFIAPDNEDTILIKKAEMYDYSQITNVSSWTIKDKTEFIEAILQMSRKMKKKELIDKISALSKNVKAEKQVLALQTQLNNLRKKTLAEIALPIDEEYDWEAIASLNKRHTAHEYRALWKLFFHPSINKTPWSRQEHHELKRIASEKGSQDWDEIANILNTKRTGYQCFVYFRTNIESQHYRRKWTKEEVEYLKRLISYYKEGNYIPWGKVAATMENRTKIQVYNKYVSLQSRRKGRFFREEDAIILNYVEAFGPDFKNMCKYLPGRSASQLRTRYNLLSRMNVSITWTVEDDKKLLKIIANQDTPNFVMAAKHFPGKDRFHIRSRYVTLMKWMKAYPETDIQYAPRRGTRILNHGHAETNLKKAVEKLKQRLQNEVKKTKMMKKITRRSRESEIDEEIQHVLLKEMENDNAQCKLANENLKLKNNIFGSPQFNKVNIRNLLILLNSKLDKKKFYNVNENTKLYENLDDVSQKGLVKVKSYSRKQSITTINLANTPSIWGENRLGAIEYVLPPNYATITGCRVLLKHLSDTTDFKKTNSINFNLLMRQNPVLKDAFNILMQRFKTLFLWPMLLSNVPKASGSNISPRINLSSEVTLSLSQVDRNTNENTDTDVD